MSGEDNGAAANAANAALACLLEAARYARDSASYNKATRCHSITQTVFSGFCQQIAITERRIAERAKR